MSDALMVRCFLWADEVPWSTELTEHFLDELAGWLVSKGFGNAGDEDSGIRSIVTAGNVEIPTEPEGLMERFGGDGSAVIVLPGAIAEDDE